MKKISKIWFYFKTNLLIIFIFLNLNILNCSNTLNKNQEPVVKKKEIKYNLNYLEPKGNLTTQILKKKYYTVGYAKSALQAEWTSYRLTRKMIEIATIMIKEKKIKRSGSFFEDINIIGITPKNKDYSNSGYDKGHLVPSFDMSFSHDSMKETYSLVNISPQTTKLNRGIWKKLEKLVREWAVQKEDLYIISAGILTEKIGYIGKNKILVPKYFYKIILPLNSKTNDIIAFIIPNLITKNLTLANYTASVNEIETKTKIDFFSKINAKIKLILKNKKNLNYWNF